MSRSPPHIQRKLLYWDSVDVLQVFPSFTLFERSLPSPLSRSRGKITILFKAFGEGTATSLSWLTWLTKTPNPGKHAAPAPYDSHSESTSLAGAITARSRINFKAHINLPCAHAPPCCAAPSHGAQYRVSQQCCPRPPCNNHACMPSANHRCHLDAPHLSFTCMPASITRHCLRMVP